MPNTVTDPWTQGTRFAQELMQYSPRLTNAETDWETDWRTQKARARDLSSRDAYGLNSVKISQDALIGRHFRLSLRPHWKALGIDIEAAREWSQLVEAEWRRYAESVTFDADARRMNTFTLMMRTVVGGLKTDGEVLATIQAKPGHAGYMTCMQLIEPERLQAPSADYPLWKNARNGVERDDVGEPIAYHILKRYPGDYRDLRVGEIEKTERVRRWNDWGRPIVLHLFDDPRPNMSRGVSGFLAVASQMKMLQTYSKAELERNLIQASIGAVVETDMNWEDAMRTVGAQGAEQFGNNLTAAAMDHLRRIAPWHEEMGIRVNGSRVMHMVPGEKLHMIQPQGAALNYEQFEQAMLRQFAAGLDVPYESLARNFSDTSYSAARMSLADIWRSYMTSREMICQKFAMPFFGCWLEEAIVEGHVPMPDGSKGTLEAFIANRHHLVAGRFISWTKPLIDPVKERTAQQMGMMMGLTTAEEEVAADGEDYLEILEQRAYEVKFRDKLGLNPLGVDPTIVPAGAAGAMQKAEGHGAQTNSSGSAE
jgi:lambda family phage portal protein